MDTLEKALLQSFGHNDSTKFIQQLYMAVHPQDGSGKTPLHFYAMFNEGGLSMEYLRCGGEVNIADKDGFLPIHYAVEYNSIECAKVLLRKGANVRKSTRHGHTAVDLAKCKKHFKIIELLEKYTICEGGDFFDNSEKSNNCISCTKAIFGTCGCILQNINSVFQRQQEHIKRNECEIAHLKEQLVPKIDKVETDYKELYFNATVTHHNAHPSAVLVGIDYLPQKTKDAIAMLQRNTQAICAHMQPSGVIDHMWASGLLTDHQKQDLNGFPSQQLYKQVQYLLDLTLKHPKYLIGLREATKATGQQHVAELLPEVWR